MRRRFWVLLHSLQWTGRCSSCKGKASADNSDGAGEEEAGAKDEALQRLVHSLGFEMQEMERLVRGFATGEKKSTVAAHKKDSASCTSLADVCTKHSVFLLPFCKVAMAYKGLRATSAKYRDTAGTVTTSEYGETEATALLHRCARRIGAKVNIRKVKGLSEIQLLGGALATLFAALWDSMRGFRREGKHRWQELLNGDAEKIKQLHTWRYEVIKMHVEAFVSLQDACRSVFGMALKDLPSRQGDAAFRQTLCLCISTINSMTLAIADELHWHLSRPSVKKNGEEERRLLERRITDCVSSMWDLTNTFLAGMVEENITVIEDAEGGVQILSVVCAIEDILAVMESSVNLPVGMDGFDDSRFFTLLIMWLLQTASSLFHAPSLNEERRFVSCLQKLWQKLAPPLEQRSSDKVMTHRTIHASLNLRYAHLRSEPQGGEGDKSVVPNPATSALLLRMLERTVSTFLSWQLKRDTVKPSMVLPYAVFCRTVLEVEVEIYFLACKKTGRELTTPTDLFHTGVDNRKEGTPTDLEWEEILKATSSLRVAVSSLVHAYMRAFVSQDLSAFALMEGKKGDFSFVKRSVYRFMSGISTSFFPLLRRHYIDSAGREVLTTSLHSFLALKQVSDVMDGDGEERRHGVNSTFRVCGVSLSQATEVAFFLSLYRRDHLSLITGSSDPADAIDGHAVSSYVKEVLFALDHNTAKQLWHLRSKKVLRCFTGVSYEGEVTDERQQRRQAQSILSVVHAHVVHPSFLWMPLFQLQEVLFVLAQNRELIEGLQPYLKSPKADDSAAIAVFHVGSAGGTLRHFAKVLGYVALRLYVVSNVLRCYREFLLTEECPSRLALGDSTSGAKKRREWAKNMALTLQKSFPGLAAEVEGLDPKRRTHRKRANRRVLARLETACIFAVRQKLLFHVKKQRRKWRAKRAMQRLLDGSDGDGGGNNTVSAINLSETVAQDEILTICLKRADARAPLGFSLYGERPCIRRLAGSEHKDDNEGRSVDENMKDTPFSAALRAAGVVEPRSVVGWCVVRIDGADVESSKAVITLVQGKHEFSMSLSPPA
ncbi:Basal body protein [Trypanosoma cruzi]|uniref:Basal body protein n=1 Tax=Trypanosoma cruzi TaxID=5693 RepID=A0A7J6Y9Y6_TRYCR|nr:Basal body protein [Trypanosoma cruzi]KAF8301763.1 Basal body protein [Trypanosoma cruzi]